MQNNDIALIALSIGVGAVVGQVLSALGIGLLLGAGFGGITILTGHIDDRRANAFLWSVLAIGIGLMLVLLTGNLLLSMLSSAFLCGGVAQIRNMQSA